MPQYWYMVEALIALARNRRDGKKPFTRADLRAWSERIAARPRSAQIALNHLEAHGLVRRVPAPAGAQPRPGFWNYVLSPEGRAAAGAAEQARCAEEKAVGAMTEPGSFDSRVYALLRTRRALSGPEAAETLVDAGEDVKAAAKQAAASMRSWAQLFPNAIKTSKQRVNGAVRFVIVEDIGPLMPATAITKKTARGGAKA